MEIIEESVQVIATSKSSLPINSPVELDKED